MTEFFLWLDALANDLKEKIIFTPTNLIAFLSHLA